MRKIVLLLMVIVFLLIGCGEEEESVRLHLPYFYDDFSLPFIDSSKWTVDTSGGGTISLANGVATLLVNTPGGDMQSTLEFPTALVTKIRSVGVRVNPTRYFQDVPSGSNVRFRITARHYKDDQRPSGGAESDIFSQLRIRNGQFQALVSRCDSATCNASSILPGASITLGPVSLNRYYDMNLSYDGGTTFSFVVDGVGSTVIDASNVGAFIKIGPPGAPRALVEVQADSGAPLAIGSMTALLDHVTCIRLSYAPC